MFSLTKGKLLSAAFAASVIILGGCQSTQTNVTSVGPSMVGPGSGMSLGSTKKSYVYNSDIYLDVAVPVFDPGFPMQDNNTIDYDEIEEEGIWPQVRRLEANRFAYATKEALAETKSFGSINVTPNASALADVYVLGKINYSDTETVEIGVRVMDAKNTVWGEEEFEYVVSEGWYRDAMSRGENPNGPIFEEIADYVYKLLKEKSESYKQEVQTVSDIRYAQMYSPEAFSQHLEQKRNGAIELVSAPAANDPMMARIKVIQAKDEQFVDSLQETYESFWVTTEAPYRKYQEETLPEAKKIRELKAERTTKQIGAVALGLAGIFLGKNSGSSLGQAAAIGAGVAAVGTLASAIQTNKELQSQRKLFDEMGQNLDIQVADQIIEVEDQRIELQGTASEQYYQLRSHLKDIYELEATPNTAI